MRMKMLATLTMAIVFSYNTCFSQDSIILLSKYERFTSEPGKMYKYETMEIGSAAQTTISVSKVTEVESGKSEKAILISQNPTGFFTVGTVSMLIIDMEEIDGVNRSLAVYQNAVKESRPDNEPSYTYFTQNDVVVGCKYVTPPVGNGWFITLAQRYHYTKSIVPNSVIYIKNKDVDNMVELFATAKAKAIGL